MIDVMRKIQVITLFPEMFDGVLNSSMMWKAQDQNAVEFQMINLRQFGLGVRRKVDDTPYGGGDGMLLMVEPLYKAIMEAKQNDPEAKVVLLTPRGERWQQSMARQWAASAENYIFVCGRYEGYDERILSVVDRQISIGDYVLTGGELAAMAVIDSIVRLMPGVLGGATSPLDESFSEEGVLEYPQYTRPEIFNGMEVPKVLLSGNHGAIKKWRVEQSKRINT